MLKQNKFQAKGAIDFEKHLKKEYKDFKIKTDLTLPGKGEFYDIEHKETMLRIYDEISETYNDVVGLKAPN